MRKQIFTAIADRLRERVPDIMFIDLWNNNITALAGGAVWPTPAVFIEFEDINWAQQGRGARVADIAVRLHVVTRAVKYNGAWDERVSEQLKLFDLLDSVNAATQGLNGDNFAGFMHTSSYTNHDHAELIESVERFVTRAQDITAMSDKEKRLSGVNLQTTVE